MSEVRYELKHQFGYAYKGEMQQAMFVTMTAPSFKQVDKVAPLKQALMAAIRDIQEVATGSTDKSDARGEITGQEVMQLLYQGKGSVATVMSHARQLFISGIALIDGETKFSLALLDEVSLDDVEGMLGEYMAAFIVPSLMGGR